MTLYSTQFFLDSVGAGGTELATVPAGYLWVIREVTVCCNTLGSVSFSAAIDQLAGGLIVPFFQDILAPDGTVGSSNYSQWKGRVVAPTATTLWFNCSIGGDLFVYVGGYQLTDFT
jgi:hypothetical protein